jgi:hypothetical protein
MRMVLSKSITEFCKRITSFTSLESILSIKKGDELVKRRD